MTRMMKDFCEGWYFRRKDDGAAMALAKGKAVRLPHTWNALDGQDGGNDYYRGTCWYVKKFRRTELPEDGVHWIEFQGAAMTADVYLNGKHLGHHEGGYSTFRVNMTEALKDENLLAVSVNNEKNRTVYPQKADFTFYGGLYRKVQVISVPETHFALNYYGGTGVKVTPEVKRDYAEVKVEAWITGDAGRVMFTIDGQIKEAKVSEGYAKAEFLIRNVHLWNGTEDPYLYCAQAMLDSGDIVEIPFGCRTFTIDPEEGFLLNGKPYRLCGAARHQDREGVGNALSDDMHEEDLRIMQEMGANTIRLAHYQHAQYFYDLCDKAGMVVWAEIPYITEHMPEGRDNTVSQMTELIIQNYHHPSIVCWGLSNEITVTGGVNNDMVENHKILNELCHRLDTTRPTTMAHAFMLDPDDAFVMLSDIRSYNLYYGWYIGETEQNDEWFDEFHRMHPQAVIGLSEYGADANPEYQNGKPEKGDWSEPYQAVYHEHMLKMWSERPYIWAMHCWNMFDFGADGRDEGGKPGQNQKGLVTFDRQVKKDAFYIYKAYLSKEPFVHVCGKRYRDRIEEVTEIKVYSNQPEVALFVDGKEFAVKKDDKIFRFEVPICGEHDIEVRSGTLYDTMQIKKVKQPNPKYVKERGDVVNWFDRPDEIVREGYYSILDSMVELKKNSEAVALIGELMGHIKKAYGDVAKNVTLPASIQRQMDEMTLEKLLKQAGKSVTPAMVKELNYALNQIEKK